MMDTRKLDMAFFISLELGQDLTFEQIEEIAKKHTAKELWKKLDSIKRNKAN